MTDWHLAQMNVGTALHDIDDPRMAAFMNQLDSINALAEATPGFVWRLQSESGNATDIQVSEDPRFIVNMSVWTNLEALFDFVYKSSHRGVMVRRRQWFARPEGAYQVLWWVKPGMTPSVCEGLARLGRLNARGPSPKAFSFKETFPAPDGATAPPGQAPDPYCVGWS